MKLLSSNLFVKTSVFSLYSNVNRLLPSNGYVRRPVKFNSVGQEEELNSS